MYFIRVIFLDQHIVVHNFEIGGIDKFLLHLYFNHYFSKYNFLQ